VTATDPTVTVVLPLPACHANFYLCHTAPASIRYVKVVLRYSGQLQPVYRHKDVARPRNRNVTIYPDIWIMDAYYTFGLALLLCEHDISKDSSATIEKVLRKIRLHVLINLDKYLMCDQMCLIYTTVAVLEFYFSTVLEFS